VISVNDGLNRRIRSCRQEQQSDQAQQNVEEEPKVSPETARLPEALAILGSPQAHVCNTPENESKERVKERAHQRQQIGEEGNDFGDDEGKDPENSENSDPAHPADESVVANVSSSSKYAEEDEARRYRGVQNSKENDRGNHKGEGNLLVHFVFQGTKSWRSHVLCTRVAINYATHQAKHDDFANGNNPERLGEILGLLHLGDETGERNLSNKRVGNVHEGVHAQNKSRALGWDCEDQRLAQGRVFGRLALGSGECGGQDHGNEGEQGGECRDLGKSVKGTGNRGQERDDGGDGCESDGAHAMAGDGIPPLGSNKTMKAHDEGVYFRLVGSRTTIDQASYCSKGT
jgi:hypothetical protein